MSFCALLYYKRLNENIDSLENGDLKMHLTKKLENGKNINEQPVQIDIMKKRKRLRNKWFLIITLMNNKFLVSSRKKEFSFSRIL